ncbi:type I-B CRISPR-associated protein Cas8b1/Cst1 [Garciella nitratireducens]|uniref:type I-B CRISPR-associated protein Cas8b1/Cst1 n=1 Tax=Garciella nitratireducens TaxID=218205 RepID=UPI000DEAE1AC|nr:type I-B CRISPR-associated protein Cas8b1/Cst1 [Garciella nitratireducens]RBP38226.1 CRISPR-associated protein Cst1 [Garciella nitratireducens]
MEEKIKIYLSDWQFNAGIVGLYNILEYAKDEVAINDQYIEIELEMLKNFEEKYFNYFIEKYKETTPWYRIVSYKPIMETHENNNFENFNKKSLDYLNDYIKMVKDYLKRPNYKKVYSFVENDKDIIFLEKELKTIYIKKSDKVEDKIDEVKNRFKTIKEIIDYCNSEDGKKYMAAKGVIYNIINNGWNGVCFLNAQTKEHDVYKDYKEYFVDETINYLKSDKEKFKYNCFVCDRKIKNMNNDLSFLNETGFDVARKTSHVWNFTNDVAICDLCKFVYSCLPAGFVYAYDKGIFINSNTSVEDLLKINRKLRDDILNKDDSDYRSLTYRALVKAINEQHSSKIQYELQDIQIVRYENERYRFNLLSKEVLKVIRESEKELKSLMNTGYRELRTNFSIYDITIDRLLNNYNMFTLIHKLLIYKITNSQSITTYYHMGHVMNLIIINVNYLKGVEGMDKVKENKELVRKARSYGYYLRQEYLNKDRDADKNKIRGVSYRLLNALKTRNTEMFMHNVITSYMYVGETIPKKLTIALENEEILGIIGYAFVTGLNGGEYKDKNQNGGENNEN